MKKYENLCVDCTALGIPCKGSDCENYKLVEVHCCNKCGTVLDCVYEVDGAELCEKCLKDRFRKDG